MRHGHDIIDCQMACKNDPVQSDEIVRRFRRDISYRKIVNLIERLANE
ncbi:hypothetical protein ACTRL1_00425 [Neisseria meningitidis]|nr:hypothetical protein [Neisseria polysaccharea]